MKIKIIQTCAGVEFSYAQGQTVDAPDHIAQDLIKVNYAEVLNSTETEKNLQNESILDLQVADEPAKDIPKSEELQSSDSDKVEKVKK